ncbi:MAG TPA: DapH/DapD/GlmU-related protein [Syntrophorhabdaceae bacterium]|nr:DapH/DapD/GlmU-related protein [Syntrophorhabdaceae bacterium]
MSNDKKARLRDIIYEEGRLYAERDSVKMRTILYLLFMHCGFFLDVCYRIANALSMRYRNAYLGELLPKIIMQFARIITSSSISHKAKIGRRFVIAYGMNIVIGEYVEIGDDVIVFNGTSFGSTIPGRAEVKQPTIGDRVLIGAGAKVLGGIRIGNDVRVGANSVVLQSCPDNVTIAGIPAKIVKGPEKDSR